MIRKIKNFAHGIEANVANVFYGRPARKIPTIGVTGTDGKTTTSSLIFHILKLASYKPAMVTTVGATIGGKEYTTGLHTTTPSSFALQKYIRKAVDEGSNYLVLEVTSHALDQNRVKGVSFKIGVLTNITHEHLDYHKTYENYVKAKAKLFKKADIAVLNKDDKSFPMVKKYCSGRVCTYSLKSKADFSPKNIKIKFPEGYEFNNENFLAAISVAKLLGISDDIIQNALLTFKFPSGRQEIVYDKNFRVIIDFAHTPNSFERILSVLRKKTKGRIIHVFGAASKRDQTKRPLMGSVATKYDNIIILTTEDSRGENIHDINGQIKMGISNDFLPLPEESEVDLKKKYVIEVPDRQKAIDLAVRLARKGDVVITTGKGHEQSMNLGSGEIEWSEHEAIKKALEKAKL